MNIIQDFQYFKFFLSISQGLILNINNFNKPRAVFGLYGYVLFSPSYPSNKSLKIHYKMHQDALVQEHKSTLAHHTAHPLRGLFSFFCWFYNITSFRIRIWSQLLWMKHTNRNQKEIAKFLAVILIVITREGEHVWIKEKQANTSADKKKVHFYMQTKFNVKHHKLDQWLEYCLWSKSRWQHIQRLHRSITCFMCDQQNVCLSSHDSSW